MKRLLALTESVAAFFLLAIASLTAGNVFLRDTFSAQIPDWFDGTKLLQGIAIFWGIAIATWRGGHIGVDIVWEHLGRRGRRFLDLFAAVVTTAFLVPLAWMVWVKVSNTGTQITNDLRLPIVWFYVVAASGATVAALLGAARVIALVRGTAPDEHAPAE
ncbi:MAG TPA: TRAP transporter small permease [Zeimonas sp.]|nr:TRAP transporter small permease [Zeimonas sp.]